MSWSSGTPRNPGGVVSAVTTDLHRVRPAHDAPDSTAEKAKYVQYECLSTRTASHAVDPPTTANVSGYRTS